MQFSDRPVHLIVIVVLVVAVGLLVADRFLNAPRVVYQTPALISADRIDSIAVLPFEDFSADDDHAYLGTGIADTVLHSLAQIEGLRVAARTSSFLLHERDADVAEIGRVLDVGAVLEGSVQVSGDRVRVIAQLVRTSDQSHIWSQTFDASTDDIFTTQDTIAEAVSSSLRGNDAVAPVTLARTSLEVFQLVARGRHLWQQRNRADTAAAVEALELAVSLDSEYAIAWSQLAAAQYFSHFYGGSDRDEAMSGALEAAARATELDETLAQPWAIRGLIAIVEGNRRLGIEHLQRALSLNVNYADGYTWTARALLNAGLTIESRRIYERAFRLDPMSAFVRGGYARSLVAEGSEASRARAIEIVTESRRLFPDVFRPINDAIYVELEAGDMQAAVDHIVDGLRLRPGSLTMQLLVMHALFMLGESESIVRWGAHFDSAAPEWMQGRWRYYTQDWAGWLDANRRMLAAQPDDAQTNVDMANALIFDGRYGEALTFSEDALEQAEAVRYQDIPGITEMLAAVRLAWLHQEVGDMARSRELRNRLSPMLALLESHGIDLDLRSVMLRVDAALVVGDFERAARQLRDLDSRNIRWFAFLWQDFPWWREFTTRDDVRALLNEWRTQQAGARKRVRDSAPAFFYDPTLLDSVVD